MATAEELAAQISLVGRCACIGKDWELITKCSYCRALPVIEAAMKQAVDTEVEAKTHYHDLADRFADTIESFCELIGNHEHKNNYNIHDCIKNVAITLKPKHNMPPGEPRGHDSCGCYAYPCKHMI